MQALGDDLSIANHNRARRVKYLLFAALAGAATGLNWLLMNQQGYSIPALAVLTSLIAWALLLGAVLPFGYGAALDDDLSELGRKPAIVRLVCTSTLVLSIVLAFATCSLLGMPMIVPL